MQSASRAALKWISYGGLGSFAKHCCSSRVNAVERAIHVYRSSIRAQIGNDMCLAITMLNASMLTQPRHRLGL